MGDTTVIQALIGRPGVEDSAVRKAASTALGTFPFRFSSKVAGTGEDVAKPQATSSA